MNSILVAYLLAGAASLPVIYKLKRRLELSVAKHPSLTGHSNWSRRLARLIPYYTYDASLVYRCDDAPPDVVKQRKDGFERLSALFASRYANSIDQTNEIAIGLSDLKFTAAYRVPFQFREFVKGKLSSGSLLIASDGVQLEDLDGNTLYDLSGSYGVNLFGYGFYSRLIADATHDVEQLGPVLGYYHPLVAPTVKKILAISGLEEVSFHMSGTEAVMQAVRLARYHTKKSHLVRFCGAYHGWWGDVQPGVGNPVPAHETYTLREMHPNTLRVLRTRKDIACVLINPLQALHPNRNAPGDAALLDSSRTAGVNRAAYTEWLQAVRAVCTARGIMLIFDEVFTGFRLAQGGAQAYFGIQADYVTYGKSLGGGLPVGVLCGTHQNMSRFDASHPADICFARGTFNAHPYVIAAMHHFLCAIERPEIQAIYAALDQTWDQRAALINQRIRQEGLGLQVAHLSSIWTVNYTQPCRFNWMFQYYLRAEGLALSWVGTGRFIFSLNYSDQEFEEITNRFIRAAVAMRSDGWWWTDGQLTNKAIKRRVLREMIGTLFTQLHTRKTVESRHPKTL